MPKEIISNNGTNFVGANQELHELRNRLLSNHRLEGSITSKGIEWNFNPPSAPLLEGFMRQWSRQQKRAISAILQNTNINDEELLTVFTGAQLLINSRPLTYQTANPNYIVPLTPYHFLIGQIRGQFTLKLKQVIILNSAGEEFKGWLLIFGTDGCKNGCQAWALPVLQVTKVSSYAENPCSYLPLGKVVEV